MPISQEDYQYNKKQAAKRDEILKRVRETLDHRERVKIMSEMAKLDFRSPSYVPPTGDRSISDPSGSAYHHEFTKVESERDLKLLHEFQMKRAPYLKTYHESEPNSYEQANAIWELTSLANTYMDGLHIGLDEQTYQNRIDYFN